MDHFKLNVRLDEGLLFKKRLNFWFGLPQSEFGMHDAIVNDTFFSFNFNTSCSAEIHHCYEVI